MINRYCIGGGKWGGKADPRRGEQKSRTDFALNRGRTVGVVRGAISAAVATAMEFCQGPDTHALA